MCCFTQWKSCLRLKSKSHALRLISPNTQISVQSISGLERGSESSTQNEHRNLISYLRVIKQFFKALDVKGYYFNYICWNCPEAEVCNRWKEKYLIQQLMKYTDLSKLIF